MQTLKTRASAVLGAVLFGTATLAGTAHADVPKMRVSYADLDVRSASDQRVLARRIDRAAREVCVGDRDQQADVDTCRDKAINGAYADLEQRGVTLR
jgi:UrcA family protein